MLTQPSAENQPKVEKLDLLLTVRCDKEFYTRVSDVAWKLRTTRANLVRTATKQYLKALEKAETLAA